MEDIYIDIPSAVNEPVKNYSPGSDERASLKSKLASMENEFYEIPIIIGGKEIHTGNLGKSRKPHDHQHILAEYHQAGIKEVNQAIDSAIDSWHSWSEFPLYERASIFRRAAELLAGPWRDIVNAATMLNQSKNVYQSEIDAACELIDFFKFNVQYMSQLYKEQPESSPGIWNRLEHRPLEGFVFALTPFNFTSICANLCAAPAMLGNVVVWKPAETQIYSAQVIMDLFKAAGLPDGVINMVTVSGKEISKVVFEDKNFAGLHFTGSTNVFRTLWKGIGNNIEKYKSYPRIVGETGGKDFIFSHVSADPNELAASLIRGAYEYQGQKCSAASRAYIPESLWATFRDQLCDQVQQIAYGDVSDFTNFMGAVIDESAYTLLTRYIDAAKADTAADILCGGSYDKDTGYFIAPTIIQAHDPHYATMETELFGPVLTVFVYPDNKYAETLDLCDQTSPYALTGSIFARDRQAINLAYEKLRHSAGNFYINDKPTGAVVGQQPFGGSRASGTNDKAGSYLNLIRWISPRTTKENFFPAHDYRYPYMQEE